MTLITGLAGGTYLPRADTTATTAKVVTPTTIATPLAGKTPAIAVKPPVAAITRDPPLDLIASGNSEMEFARQAATDAATKAEAVRLAASRAQLAGDLRAISHRLANDGVVMRPADPPSDRAKIIEALGKAAELAATPP